MNTTILILEPRKRVPVIGLSVTPLTVECGALHIVAAIRRPFERHFESNMISKHIAGVGLCAVRGRSNGYKSFSALLPSSSLPLVRLEKPKRCDTEKKGVDLGNVFDDVSNVQGSQRVGQRFTGLFVPAHEFVVVLEHGVPVRLHAHAFRRPVDGG